MTDSEKGLPTAAEIAMLGDDFDGALYRINHDLVKEGDELVRRSDVKALIESEGRTLYECSICGYISSDVQEVADCCHANAVHYDFIRKIDLVQKVEGEASE